MTALLFSTFSYSSPKHTKTNVSESHKFEFSHVMKKIFNLNSIQSNINILQSSVPLNYIGLNHSFIYAVIQHSPSLHMQDANQQVVDLCSWEDLGHKEIVSTFLQFDCIIAKITAVGILEKLANWCFWWERLGFQVFPTCPTFSYILEIPDTSRTFFQKILRCHSFCFFYLLS